MQNQPSAQPLAANAAAAQAPAAGTFNFTPQGLNGGWQSDSDYQERRKMIGNIVLLLQQRKPNAPPEWLKKLPQMAKRLEESLYRSAKSFAEYNDSSTIKQRLQQLAMSIGMKTKKFQQQQQLQKKLQQQQQQQQVQAQAQQPVVAPTATVAPVAAPVATAPRTVNLSDINPMIAPPVPAAPAPAAVPAAPVQQVQYKTAPAPAPVAATAPAPAANGARPVSDRQQVLRHQQQRLLLLRHAAKCQHEDNKCPVTPHCAGMKRLWKHIAECKNQKCLVPHCVSSRYVLSHYHRCKDVRCPVCGPVREAIHRSHEKQKNMQALKQRHEAAVQQASQQPDAKRRKTTTTKPASVPGLAFSNGQVIMPKTTGPKPQEDHTLINCFSVEQIELHIASLNNGLVLPPLRLKAKGMDVLKSLQSHQHAWVFNSPVDPVELGLPDYFQVIKHPMDLGTVRKKLENGVYHKLEEVEAHILLTFNNAMLYNPEGSVVYNMAKEMKEKFRSDYAKLLEQLNAEEDVKRRNGEACLLCGCEKLLFEPLVFYCNGMNCPSKRIRRNSYYYVAGNNQYHWCHTCYQELRDNTQLDLGDVSVKKEEMVKKKNDEVHEESWVQCDRCERWVHQICALFNTRQNKDQRSEYACPRCTVEERKKQNLNEATSSTPMAEDLPRTRLSEYLEKKVREKVEIFFRKKAEALMAKENIPFEEARRKVETGGAITIRQVTSMDRKLEVRERMKKRYAFKNYPDEFNFRCKCIVVFQNLDGVDVILFGLYVYEHDEKNPAPNTRAVYVSYLDSVHYMRPREMRTVIYHEILISYLDHVRRRGFSTAHIWACPPLKGDDYILYAKPEDQKVPKDDRLRQWYVDMLVESQRRGIVGTVTNMYDLYFSDPKADATVVPYMDGDYFPAEVENIIKDIDEGKAGKGKKSSSKGKSKDKKAKQKKKSGRGGTRSAGLDEEAFRASGVLPIGADPKSLQEGARDYVMVKLGDIIQPMKESFIVAYLARPGAKEEHMVVPKAIQEYRDKHNITWKLSPEEEDVDSLVTAVESDNKVVVKVETPTPMEVDKPAPTTAATVSNGSTASQPATAPPAAAQPATPAVKIEPTATSPAPPQPVGTSSAPAPAPPAATSTATPAVKQESTAPAPAGATPTPAASTAPAGAAAPPQVMEIRAGKFAAMARKRERTGDPKTETSVKDEKAKEKEKKPTKTITVKDSKGRLVKVLDDDDEELDCEFLNNRQAFLNLCQGNHYQFDQIRRAKHSSMMVLWHLHNRDAPKFVQQCATCSREILTGYRFHCPTCADFDQCQECYQSPNVARHPHQLKPMPIASAQQNELTETQRKERQRSIQLHMTLLQHAATCPSPKCPSANCTKMKGLLKHGSQCQVKATGGCNVCKRIWALLQIHARQCKAKSCPVPNCMAIRERVRQLKKQQQAMDDRRRQEMNRAYHSRGAVGTG